jgi:hypothetical protein
MLPPSPLPPIIAVASSLASGTLDALVETIATCHPNDWPYTRVQVMQVVPHPPRHTSRGALLSVGAAAGRLRQY